MIVGISFVLNGIRARPFAGQPEFPPTKEEMANAKPPGKIARILFITAGILLITYSIYALLN